METIIGIHDARPKLSALIDSENPVIITVNSEPKSVLVKYEEYIRLKKADQYSKQAALKQTIDIIRNRAKAEELTEKDITGEINAVRSGESKKCE
jgi:antitoxin YefM